MTFVCVFVFIKWTPPIFFYQIKLNLTLSGKENEQFVSLNFWDFFTIDRFDGMV